MIGYYCWLELLYNILYIFNVCSQFCWALCDAMIIRKIYIIYMIYIAFKELPHVKYHLFFFDTANIPWNDNSLLSWLSFRTYSRFNLPQSPFYIKLIYDNFPAHPANDSNALRKTHTHVIHRPARRYAEHHIFPQIHIPFHPFRCRELNPASWIAPQIILALGLKWRQGVESNHFIGTDNGCGSCA